MILRRARSSDASQIAALQNAIIRDTLITFTTDEKSVAQIEAQIVDSVVTVAEVEGQFAGFASFGPFRNGPGYAHVAEHSIHLEEHARGQGVGRALMAQLEAEAVAQGIAILIAGISGANPTAVAFHEACGFVKTGALPGVGRKQGRTLDLILMQKRLA